METPAQWRQRQLGQFRHAPRRHLTWRGYLQWAAFHREFYAPFNESDLHVLATLSANAARLAAHYRTHTEQPLVSVIMPVWNRAHIVGEAIRSVLAQTYTKWELIVVDDGSSDASVQAVRTFDDPRIRLHERTVNGGAGAARNDGLRLAGGALFAYLDSDNLWSPEFLTVMAGTFVERSDVQIAYCAQSLTERFADDTLEGVRFAPFGRARLENDNYIDIGQVMHDRRFLARVDGFDVTLTMCEDWDLLLRGTAASPAIAVPALLSHYRHDARAGSRSLSGDPGHDVRTVDGTLSAHSFRLPITGNGPVPPEAVGRVFYPPMGSPPALRTRPLVTIVIPSFQAAVYLDACLQAVTAFTPAGRYEVVIVDNASDEATRAVIQRHLANPAIRLLANATNEGFSCAANRGIRAAKAGSPVVLLNNDALVTPGWLDGLQEVAETCAGAGLIVPRQVLLPRTPTMSAHVPYANPDRELDVTLSAHHGNVIDPDLLPSRGFVELAFAPFFCVWITPECLARAGLLDAGHGPHYGSDRLYCDVARDSAGLRVVYTPHAKVYHFLQRATFELQASDPERLAAFFSRMPDPMVVDAAASFAPRSVPRAAAAAAAGTYRAPTDLAPLRPAQQAIVDEFSKLTWELWTHGVHGRGTLDAAWLGARALKCPLDLWTYQEILTETRPDLIIETGTHAGGSGLFLASICELLGNGRVISIDTVAQPDRPSHPRLTYVAASSTSPDTVTRVTREAAVGRVMVILDSDHSRDHVLAELDVFADLVTPGCYLVVEDTVVNGHPFCPDFGPGPWEAVDLFLARRGDYAVDRDRERFLMTLNPRGYLRRRSEPSPSQARLDAAGRARLERLAAELIDLDGVAVDDGSVAEVGLESRSLYVRRALRVEGRDWPAHGVAMTGLVRLNQVRAAIETVVAEGVPGDVIETGIWRGGTCILMRAALRELGAADRLVWCADSFAGLPRPDAARYPADAGDRHHEHAVLRVSRAEVEANFTRFGQLDAQVRFLEGWFEDTLPDAPIEQLAVLRLDGDMYGSTMQALDSLYHRLSPGGFVIVDDYGAVQGCQAAVDDFRAAHGIGTPLEYIDWASRCWRVPRRYDVSERARLLAQPQVLDPLAALDIVPEPPGADEAARVTAAWQARADGNTSAAEAAALDVLERWPNSMGSYGLLAAIRLSGPDYRVTLRELHEALRPRTYVELGVFRGESLTLARTDTRVIGVDPRPVLDAPPGPHVRLFTCTSGAFFGGGDAERWLDGGFDLAFVDASHAMADALLDVMALERFARPGATMAMHDTWPIDARVATPRRETTFYTGDVWKVVAALRVYRPDLVIETLDCQPSGLTLIRNLDPHSRVLWQAYDEIVERFGALPFSAFGPEAIAARAAASR